MEDHEYSQEQTCKECGSAFMANNAKQKYCQASCRKAHHLKRKAQKEEEEAQQLIEKTAQLKDLQEAASTPAPSVPPANARWRKAKRACDKQQGKCDQIKQQLAENHQTYLQLSLETGPGKGFWQGGLIGVILVLILIAIGYEARLARKQPVGVAFKAVSAGSLILYGWVGSALGHLIQQEQRGQKAKEAFDVEVEKLQHEKQSLTETLEQAESKLEALLQALDEIDPDPNASPGE